MRAAFIAAFALSLAGCPETVSQTPESSTVEPAAPAMKRLTRAQYTASVRDLFGDIVVPTRIEPDLEQEGFLAIGAAHASVSGRGVELYEDAAFTIAEQAISDDLDDWIPCTPVGARDDVCARAALGPLTRRAWRRAVSSKELERIVALAGDAGEALGDFRQGLVFGVARVLQSPNFLFRIERGEPDGDGGRRYTSTEMASRVSFLLWNAPPDELLLEAGIQGGLLDDRILAGQANRMLDDPRAREGLRNFFDEFLGLRDLADLSKDPTVYLHASPELGPDAREETLRVVERWVFDVDGDYRDLMTTRDTIINRRLAALYDVPLPQPEGFQPVSLPEDGPRAGLLGHASFLALHAHATDTSPTLRGLNIRTVLLCGFIPPPPSDVDTSLPVPSPTAPTLRERLTEHRENPVCAGCHALMDPIGLGMEQFDGVGRFRAAENGADIDPSGDVDGLPFADARELGALLRDHPDLPRCLVKSLYRYANGHTETAGEKEALEALYSQFEGHEYRVREFMVDLVMSPGFRRVGEVAE